MDDLSRPLPDAGPAECIAFEGARRLAAGSRIDVARKVKQAIDRGARGSVLVFDARTSAPVDFDLRGDVDDVVRRERVRAERRAAPAPRGPGRPKLGVVAREVTLLPRHWDWLADQPGGASVALRRLVERARHEDAGPQRRRQAQESAYRFMLALAGDRPRYEEATRALFAGDRARFERLVAGWPAGIRAHLQTLTVDAFGS